MAVNYGLAGTNPFRDWQTGPVKVLADYLLSQYDATLLDIASSEVKWNQPWSGGAGDFTVWFQKVQSFSSQEALGGGTEDEDIYIHMHIFVRSLHHEYHNQSTGKKSAEYYLDRFERWARKTAMENRDALIPEGIIRWRIIEARDIPMGSNINTEVPNQEIDYHEQEVMRRIIFWELKVEHRYIPIP